MVKKTTFFLSSLFLFKACSLQPKQDNTNLDSRYFQAYKELYVYSVCLQQNSLAPNLRDSLFFCQIEKTCKKTNISKEELTKHYEKLTTNPDLAIPFYDSLISEIEKDLQKNN